jgi:hypothetical protein
MPRKATPFYYRYSIKVLSFRRVIAQTLSAKCNHLIVVGAQKAGTTTLHSLLSKHPQVVEGVRKELHYFDFNFVSVRHSYLRKFEKNLSRRPLSTWLSPTWLLDSSPSYLAHPLVASRIKNVLPEARLVVLLRNPAERAVSHYFHNVRAGREVRTFDQAIRDEISGEMSQEESSWDDSGSSLRHFSYLARGDYERQLQSFFTLFDQDQISVHFSEIFFQDPTDTVNKTLRLMGLTSNPLPIQPEKRNVGKHSSEELHKFAREIDHHFAESNRRLESLLGEKLPW